MEDHTLIKNIATKSKACMLILTQERSKLTSSTAKVSFTTISSQISEKLSLNRTSCQIPTSTLFNRAKILTTMPSATVSHQCSTKTKQRGTLLDSQSTALVSESICLIKSESLVQARPIKIKTTLNSPIKSCSLLISATHQSPVQGCEVYSRRVGGGGELPRGQDLRSAVHHHGRGGSDSGYSGDKTWHSTRLLNYHSSLLLYI